MPSMASLGSATKDIQLVDRTNYPVCRWSSNDCILRKWTSTNDGI